MTCLAFDRAHPARGALAVLCAAALVVPLLAPAQPAPDTQSIVVTANRTPQPLSSVLADVSVVDRATIERSGAVAVADVLARLPGIEFSRTGGPGTQTGVFIRGAETRHTAVYIDGVRVDSQATGGAVWEQIPLDRIDRIEVLRGPAAAAYGSDAVAGVVQLFTRRGRGAPRPTAAITGASHGTGVVELGVAGATQALDYAVSASHGRSDGFDSRVGANPDDDGYRRTSVQASVGLQLAAAHRVDASLLASRLRSQYDGFVPGLDDWNHHGLHTAALAWQGRWSPAATTRLQLGRSDSTLQTRPSFYRTETTLRNATLQHDQRLGAGVLTATVERREDELLNPAAAFSARLEGERHQNAVGLGWRADHGAHGVQLHLRRDQDSEFGGKSSGSVAWGWTFVPQWRLSAAAATSFRVPTLYQRFSEYGNAALVPETGRNAEVALRWAAADSEAAFTVWHNRVGRLIDWRSGGSCASALADPVFGGCYVNVGRAALHGATLAGRAQWAGVALRAALSWHDPRNADTHQVLPRRARRLASLGADTRAAGVSWGAEVQAAGHRFEDAANTQRLGGWGLVNVYAATAVGAGLTLQARIDNVGDKRPELAQGYATPGRQAQLTLRWAPRSWGGGSEP